MENRNFELSFEEHECTIDGLKGKLKTVKVLEKLPDGKSKIVHSDIHFVSHDKKPGYRDLLKLFQRPSQANGRRAA